MSVLIRKAKISDPSSRFYGQVMDVLVVDGNISRIASGITEKAEAVIEGDDLHISPGWVDVMADYCEPGYEHKETIETGLKVAAAGGFTHVLLAPNTQPAITTKSALQFLLQKANGNPVEIHPLGGISQNVEGKALAEMLDMHEHGALAFTDGWKPLQNANLMLKAMEYVRTFDGVLLQIPQDASLSAGGLMHEGVLSTRLGMAGIPVLSETLFIHRDIELLRYTGSRLHITGVTTAAGLDMIRRAKEEGLDITCSVTPYHLALNEEALKDYDSAYKVFPVLRSEEDRQALIAGLKDGTIDCIASHHRPQDWDAKEKEFEYAGDGMGVQDMSFNIILEAVGNEVSMDRIISALSVNPRKIFGLPEGGIAEGSAADLTVYSPEGKTQRNRDQLASLSRNNPFAGRNLPGSVEAIINRNKTYLNR